jgi:predicted Fe-Mo cluster-binding NifX family protein
MKADMKIAFSSSGADVNSPVDPRFGRAKYFVIFDTGSNECNIVDNTVNLNAVQGAGIQSAKNIVDAGVDSVVTGNMGPKAFTVLGSAGIKVFTGATGSISDALLAWKSGELNEAQKANVEGHWM